MARTFSLLSPVDSNGAATDRQRELASELGRDEKRATLADWLAAQPASVERESELRMDRHLAELTALGGDPTSFAARVSAIAGELSARQALLTDSLLVDLAHAVKERREKSTRFAELRELAAELANDDSAAARTLPASTARWPQRMGQPRPP